MDSDQDEQDYSTVLIKRIAKLRQELASKDAHIAMLEEKLMKMSLELAASKAREDEQELMLRRSSQSHLSQITMMSEDEDIKSAPSRASLYQLRRFSLPVSFASQDQDETLHDSARSQESGAGVGGIIGKMVQLDRSNVSEDLTVNFPSGQKGRRRTDEDLVAIAKSPPRPRETLRRRTFVGQLFRLGTSERTGDDAAQDIISERERGEVAPLQRRRSSQSLALEMQASSRLISSTVAFPKEDDPPAFGFDE